MPDVPNNNQKPINLQDLFNFPNDGYHNPIKLLDTLAGFSVYKESDKSDFKSLFRVYIPNESYTSSDPVKDVVVSASYGKTTDEGITVGSTEFKRGMDWPIEVTSKNDFTFDLRTTKFYYQGNEIEPLEVLNIVNRVHNKPKKFLVGLPIRLKLRLRDWSVHIPNIFGFLLFAFSGRKIERNVFKRLEMRRIQPVGTYPKNDVLKESEKLNIFGYHASVWAVSLYAIIHLILYFFYQTYGWYMPWMTIIYNNNFMVVMYVVVTLGIVDRVIPRLLEYLVNHTTDWVSKILFRPIKIS